MSANISKRSVDALRPREGDTVLWDGNVCGFGIRCRASGVKYYVLKYRAAASRQRWITIGRHGAPWTPDTAKKEALRLLGEIAAGRDPADRRETLRQVLTVSELCDRYVAEGCTTKKPTTIATDRSNIERHIKPLLGRMAVTAVTRADIEQFQRDVAAGKTAADLRTRPRGRAVVTGGKGTAARSVAVLGAIFTFAVQSDLRPNNPVRGVKTYKGLAKKRFLSAIELAQLGDALLRADKQGVNPHAIAGIRLLLLTGARKSEILTLQWDHIDTERSCLRLPDSKTGAKVIPLGAAALEVLAELPRLEGNPHVLPSVRGRHFGGLQKVWERIRNQAGLQGVRLHDFRHSFATIAVSSGDSLYLVGKVLGHKQSRTTEIYAHAQDYPLRALADRTSRQIATALKSGTHMGSNVVEISKSKR